MSLPTLPSSVDDLVNNLNTKLQSAIDHIAPVRYKKIPQKQKPPWRNQNINQLKRNCRKAERRWRKTKLQVHHDILKELLAEYNTAVRHAR